MTTETKWTKGPWTWEPDRFHGGYSGLFSGDTPVIYPQRANDGDEGAAWFDTDPDYSGDEALSEANASLIAAAPEMAEFIQRMIDERILELGWMEEAEGIMAKARGETE